MLPLAATLLLALGLSGTAQAASCGEAGTGLSVVTYNTWGLPAPVARDRRGRMPRIATWLDDRGYDVAGLQEVWRGALRLLPLRTVHDRAGGDSGLALVSALPMSATRARAFSAERGFDRFKTKGVLTAEVDVGTERPVVVAVTHLQSGGGARNAAVRTSQVGEIIEAIGSEDLPVVLMGDFNFYDAHDEDNLALLHEAGFIDAAAAAGATEGTYPGVRDRFDRIYVRDGSQRCLALQSAAVLADTQLSDHRPVEAQVRVAPR